MNDWVLLIDFGTSFSRAAIVDVDGRVEPIEVDGAAAMPSGVWADPAGRLTAGLVARRQARLAPERWDRAPKRSLGQPTLPLGQTQVAVPTVIAQVFRQLSAEAIKRRGGAPRQVRLTCPARLDTPRRNALLAAARLAGLDAPAVAGGVRLVDTPFAASRYLAEHGKLRPGGTVAMFDLGGGGVETTVIESVGDRFEIRALGGIAGLGGEMFDDLLYQRVVIKGLASRDPQLARRLLEPPDAESRRSVEGLFREIRRAKEELSQSQSVELDVAAMTDLPLWLSRFEVEAGLRPEILRSARELAATIELTGLRARALDAVYLTGGSSRMPLVGRVIFDVLGVHPTALLDESSFLAGAASWTPQDRIDLETTPVTRAGRKLEAEVPTQPLTEPGGIRLADIRAALTQAEPAPAEVAEPVQTRPVEVKTARSKLAKTRAAVTRPATVLAKTVAGGALGGSSAGGAVEAGPVETVEAEPAVNGSAAGAGPAAAQVRTADGKTADGRTAEGKAADGRTAEGKAADGRTADGKAAEGRTAEGKTTDGRTAERKAADRKAAEGRTADGKTTVGRATGARSGRGRSGAAGAQPTGAATGAAEAGRTKTSKAERARAQAAASKLRNGDAGKAHSGLTGGPDSASPVVRSIWRRRWPLIAVLVALVLLGLLALKFPASGNDAQHSSGPTGTPTATPTPSVTPSAISSTVGAVTGLADQIRKTAIELRWQPVPGAASYQVRRDPGETNATIFPAARNTFGDRPGDGDRHVYTVVAVDGAGLPGPAGPTVQGRAAAPYGPRQNIASAWTGIVPPAPGARGSAGQICHGAAVAAPATGLLRCRFQNGVRLDITSYATVADRDLRGAQVAAQVGVQSSPWSAAPGSHGGTMTGQLQASTAVGGPRSKVAAGPWRWWTFDTQPTYAMYAVWPGHSPQQLSHWWWSKAPFRR